MSIARHHAEWLSLLEISGPFLSLPVLLRVFPQGLDEDDPDQRRELRLAYEEWLDNQFGLQPDPAIHQAWIRYVLTQILQLPDEVLAAGQAIPQNLKATIAEQQETLRPDVIVQRSEFRVQSLEPETLNPELGTPNPELLIQTIPADQGLDRPLKGHHWKASPAMRMMELLHATGIRLGLVTNGEQWLLVNAPRGETTGFITWYAELWLEEKITLRAFRSLLGVHRFFSVAEDETLAAMLGDSQSEQHEVTDQLGYQVRRAVEVLVQAINMAAIDMADRDRERSLPAGVSEADLYEAALTVMMRLVFLFSAEERGLFPLDDDLYQQHYAASTLREQLREAADQFGEAVIERRLDAWCRLLTIFRAIHSGIDHDRLRLPAYGGSLFDPDRFEFLEGRPTGSQWRTTPADPLPINNRTVLHLLEALQLLQVRVPGGGPSEARRLSFRALDIEQIGHVYESLLDHTAVRAETVVLGLSGSKYNEPEILLTELEKFGVQGSESPVQNAEPDTQHPKLRTPHAELIKFLKDQTGRTPNALRKALQSNNSESRTQNSEPGTRNAKLRVACGNDDALYRRVLPFAGLLREDDLGHPVVILPGSVYVTAGTERRATGTHYTPRSLTEPIVQHTLEPLVYDGPAAGKPQAQWRLKSPAHLLNLKICDMAMGSGAFLVQTCRYLSERLVEAWENSVQSFEFRVQSSKQKTENSEPGTLNPELITPEGRKTTNPDEAIPPGDEDRLILAKRLVADRCLYGVDKNPLAVEMAKLSLWLVTLDKNRPFTFLDHALKCGDSLVGVNLDQLTTWNLAGEGKRRFETLTIKAQIDQMVELRRRIANLPVNSMADQDHKRHLFEEAEALAHDLRQGGDMLVGSYFNDLKKDEQETLRTTLLLAFRDGQDVPPERAAQADLGNLRPFHWPLEFPEVFLGNGHGGFDVFVGNPPFLGGTRISTLYSMIYLNLIKLVFPTFFGRADICSLFLVQVFNLLHGRGKSGLITTNTISQGDTRETGLDFILNKKGEIFRAEQDVPWPGVAAVIVSVVHIGKQQSDAIKILNEKRVLYISSLLTSFKTLGDPYKLASNEGLSFIGSYLYGKGFVINPKEAEELILKSSKNQEVLFPYLNGKDLNTSPDQFPTRWVINFSDWGFEKASRYPECLQILTDRVKPARDKVVAKGKQIHEYDYWKFWDKRLEYYALIEDHKHVLVRTRVTSTHAFAFVKPRMVYSDAIVVFTYEEYYLFTLLQSSLNEHWAWQYGSTLKQDLRYSPTDCFQTFPFPNSEPGTLNSELEIIGETYHEHRRQLMLARQEGLTKTYNRFHNPEETASDIAQLRDLHVAMDQAVAAAYGWSDLALDHGFHETAQGLRYTISESARREVLGRLLALNHARYEAEVKAGLHQKKKPRKGAKSSRKKGKGKKDEGQMKLF